MVYFGGVDPMHLQEVAPGDDEARRRELDALVGGRSSFRESRLPRRATLSAGRLPHVMFHEVIGRDREP